MAKVAIQEENNNEKEEIQGKEFKDKVIKEGTQEETIKNDTCNKEEYCEVKLVDTVIPVVEDSGKFEGKREIFLR